MTLYNCRHAGDQYRVTKFDNHMNVESSYLCTTDECDCPAGVRPTCRHRQMLPKFIQREHVGDEWFLDFDRGGWVQMGLEYAAPEAEEPEGLDEDDGEALQSPNPKPTIETMRVMPANSTPEEVLEAFSEMIEGTAPPLPEGVVMMTLDDPAAVHNAIAEAVGEPEATLRNHSLAPTGPVERPKAVFIRRRL